MKDLQAECSTLPEKQLPHTPLAPGLDVSVPEPDSVREARAFIGATVRITISDGRRLTGRLECLDKELNMVLKQATESRPSDPDGDQALAASSERSVGLIMIPGAHVVKCEVDDTTRASEGATPAPDAK